MSTEKKYLPTKDTILYTAIALSAIIGWFTATGVKSQFVRLLDVFIIAPLLLYVGYIHYITYDVEDYKNITLYTAVIVIGITTLTYNLRNFLTQGNKEKDDIQYIHVKVE